MEDSKLKYSQLEIARIIGEPLDPRKPYPELISTICETDYADPDEYVYYFDVLLETDVVHTITSTGAVTSVNVTPDTPAPFTFIDIASPEYYVKLTDLASAKERVLARKNMTINRAMNAYELKYVVSLLAAAAASTGNQEGLLSGATTFNFHNMINLIDMIKDYSDNYVLVAGANVDKDILLWDWTDNKYTSLAEALAKLNITIIRLKGTVTIDGSAGSILDPDKAYLVGTSTVMGKPLLFVRKRLNAIDLLGAAIKENGDAPERLIFASPNPLTPAGGTTRYLAVGLTGFEEIVAACTNQYAIAEFTRA